MGNDCVHTSLRKIRILSSIRDHRKKVGKQGRLPTPADILLNIQSLIQSIPQDQD